MVANLLSLRNSLVALQTTQALWFRGYMKITIELVHTDIGLHNYNMYDNRVVKRGLLPRKHPEVEFWLARR